VRTEEKRIRIGNATVNTEVEKGGVSRKAYRGSGAAGGEGGSISRERCRRAEMDDTEKKMSTTQMRIKRSARTERARGTLRFISQKMRRGKETGGVSRGLAETQSEGNFHR